MRCHDQINPLSKMIHAVSVFGFNLLVFLHFMVSCPIFGSFCLPFVLVTRGRRSSTIRISSQGLPGLSPLTGRLLTLICEYMKGRTRSQLNQVKVILKWFRLKPQMNQPTNFVVLSNFIKQSYPQESGSESCQQSPTSCEQLPADLSSTQTK